MFRPVQNVRIAPESAWIFTSAMGLLFVGIGIFLFFTGIDWVIAGYSAKATWQHLGWSLLITAISGWLVYRTVRRIVRKFTVPAHNS